MNQDLYCPVATLYVFPTKDEAAAFSSKLSPLTKKNPIAKPKEYSPGTWAKNCVRRASAIQKR